MTTENYITFCEEIKEKKKGLTALENEVRETYIEANKPFPIDTEVKITFESGRTDTGLIKSFGILHDKEVYVTSYKSGAKMKYISTPYNKIEKL
jgi:hypothetical protein